MATLLLGVFVRVIIGLDVLADPLISAGEVAFAFVLGVYHDLWAFLLILSPVALAVLVLPKAARLALFAVCVAMLVVTFAEVFFWWEFAGRLNRLVFHYLLFPQEVLVFLEDQFYLSVFVLPALAVAYVVYRGILGGAALAPGRSRAMTLTALGGAACAVLWVQPWDFSDSRRINEMASNGYLGVLRAARTDEGRWHGEYWRPAAEHAAPPPRPAAGDPTTLPGIKHLVLIVEESFGGDAWRDPGQRQRYLPRFSALMRSGMYFSRLYATGSRTTRGLEAVLNGYPPLPGIAVTQRPGFERLPSLAKALARQGFHNIFVYGGWPDFSNFSTYWESMGYGEQTSRHDFPDTPFETSWGVPDEVLFARVRAEMNRLTATHEHVFLTTLTVSHHRPFDFPPDRINFPASERRSEYALAYADWALGDFLDKSRSDPWYASTLFVVVADHGPRVIGNGPVPVEGFRVPMVFYSPDHIAPVEIDHVGSTMSLGVTLLNLLGLDNVEGLYGTDLLTHTVGVAPVEHDYHVGLVTADGLTVLHRKGAISSWWFGPQGLVRAEEVNLVAGARAAELFESAHDRFYAVSAP